MSNLQLSEKLLLGALDDCLGQAAELERENVALKHDIERAIANDTEHLNEIAALREALELARSWVATRLGDTHEDLQKIDRALKASKPS